MCVCAIFVVVSASAAAVVKKDYFFPFFLKLGKI